jgi:hypothetical protein
VITPIPKLEGGLAHIHRDPDLAEWIREQISSYDAIRSKLPEIEHQPISLRRLSVNDGFASLMVTNGI